MDAIVVSRLSCARLICKFERKNEAEEVDGRTCYIDVKSRAMKRTAQKLF